MSDIWKFSSLSEPHVEKWLQKAVTIEDNNKWSEKFKHLKKSYLDYYNVKKLDEECITKNISDSETPTSQNAMDTSEIEEEVHTKQSYDENFCNVIESEPLTKVEYIIVKCLKNPNLITELAEHLSTNAIDKKCNTIFANSNVDSDFIPLFLLKFFPTFLRRDHSWLALDLLIKANKTYPEQFKPVLIELINDIDIKSSVLQEFIQNSNTELQKHFISVLMHINITSEIFLHHLHTIYAVYKDFKKTENVQSFIQSILIDNSIHCTNDKNYGRLFLAFLQAQKLLRLTTNYTMLEKVIEQHKSPFKRPCLSILNEMKE